MTSDLVDSVAAPTAPLGGDELPLRCPPVGLFLEPESASADTMTRVVVRRLAWTGRLDTIHANREDRWLPVGLEQLLESPVPVAAASSRLGDHERWGRYPLRRWTRSGR